MLVYQNSIEMSTDNRWVQVTVSKQLLITAFQKYNYLYIFGGLNERYPKLVYFSHHILKSPLPYI